jgi:hypothetical protein
MTGAPSEQRLLSLLVRTREGLEKSPVERVLTFLRSTTMLNLASIVNEPLEHI